MTAIKYHKDINGYYVRCRATVQACRRQGGGHITSEQYKELRANGSPEVRSYAKVDPDSPLGKAKAEYEYTSRQLDRSRRFNSSMAAQERKIIEKQGFAVEEVLYPYSLQSREALQVKKEAVLNEIKQSYIDNGVHPGKAHWLVQDISDHESKTGEWKVKVPTRDKYDKDIKAKANATKEAVANSEKMQNLQAEYAATKARQEEAKKLHHRLEARKEESRIKHDMPPLNVAADLSMRRDEARKILEYQNKLSRAGVPTQGRVHSTVSEVRGSMLSVDKKGNINNLWAENSDGSVTRIVKAEGGNLYGAGGEEFRYHTHYHSYKKHVTNSKVVITAPKGEAYAGDNYPVQHTMIDSGG